MILVALTCINKPETSSLGKQKLWFATMGTAAGEAPPV